MPTFYDELPIDRKVGYNISLRRKQLGLSQVSLASKLYLSRYVITGIEQGTRALRVEEVALIAIALNCDQSQLIP